MLARRGFLLGREERWVVEVGMDSGIGSDILLWCRSGEWGRGVRVRGRLLVLMEDVVVTCKLGLNQSGGLGKPFPQAPLQCRWHRSDVTSKRNKQALPPTTAI